MVTKATVSVVYIEAMSLEKEDFTQVFPPFSSQHTHTHACTHTHTHVHTHTHTHTHTHSEGS